MRKSTRFGLLVLLTLMVPLLPFAVIGELPGDRWLSAQDGNAGLYGLTGALLLASDVLLPIPSSIVGSLLGARLGFLSGLLFAWSGLVVGNLIGYGVGRLLLARLARDLPRTPTSLALFLSRPVPVLAEAVCISAGAARLPMAAFLGLVVAGNGIYALILAANGAALLPDRLVGPGLAIPMLVPVAGWLLWRWMAGRESTRRSNTR